MSTTELDLAAVAAETVHSLAVADFQPASSDAWPGRVTAVVTLQGCPWRCAYCQHPECHDPSGTGRLSWTEVLAELEKHRDTVTSVVFGGGEPSRQPGLAAAMREARALGYSVGLHTMGAHPARLASILELADWVGFDLKGTIPMYARITGADTAGLQAWASLELVDHSGIDYEVQLVVDPTVHTREDVLTTVAQVIRAGFHAPVLQQPRMACATAEYRRALAGRGLFDVIAHDDLPDLLRR